MPQTAAIPVRGRITTPSRQTTEIAAEGNLCLYGCPLNHIPNAETIAAMCNAEAGVGLHKVKDLDELRRIMVGA